MPETLIDFTFVLLALSVGFAATVWGIMGWGLWPHNKGRSVANWVMAVADFISFLVIGARLIDRPFDLPMGITTLILLPIIFIPPMLRLRDWMVARAFASREMDRTNE